MSISHFFIARPVFAWVIALIMMIAGALAILRLPIEQYPTIASPTVVISATYPGANAKTVENGVIQVLEQKLTGIDNLRYFNSASSDGSGTITLTFEPQTNADIAQVQTQNKIQASLPQLPLEVQQQGVIVTKSNSSFLLVAGFYSEDDSISEKDLGDLLASKVQDAVARVNGVGNITVFGEPHAMRIWLNPDKLLSYGLTVLDIQNAIQVQNADVSAGQLGALPAVQGQQLNATINAQSRLKTVAEFERIIVRMNTDGSQVRLKDLARVELGSEQYTRIVRYKRHPASGIGVSLATGANALNTAKAVKQKIAEISKTLPPAIKIIYPYDTTPFIKLSIKNVVITLFEAMILVFFVMYLFLQNFRATLIPGIAVPVVLLGTFAVLFAFGFTINVLTMFAMVLAIGLLVDDAIVVVENVERIMDEEKVSPLEATKKSMDQITAALIGITLVLSAVFIPMAFFRGSAGAIYRQFSITLVSAMSLSVLVALVLSPALCATFLKPNHNKAFLFEKFNQYFNKSRDKYHNGAAYIMQRMVRFFGIYAVLSCILILVIFKLPTSFLPNEDQGVIFLLASTPSGSSAQRTLESVKKIEDYVLEKEKNNVDHLFTLVGYSFTGIAQNAALGFVGLKDWSKRSQADQTVFSISKRITMGLMGLKDAMTFAIFPPPIRELGNSSGFDLQLVDFGGLGHDALMQARNQMLGMASKNPNLVSVRPNGLEDVAQFKLDINSEKATAMTLSLFDINQTLKTAWGSTYVNDFLDQERIKKVYVQADAPFRMLPEDVNRWYVRNAKGEMVAFSEFSTHHWGYGSPKLERFNGISSVNIQGDAAPGVSTGSAMKAMEAIATQLPKGFIINWTGLSYEERLAGAQAPMLYTLSILMVFLCLAALYNSWSIPIAVLLSIPLGVLGTVLGTWIMGLSNDVYFQVALLTTVGLAAKNAILIVQFAQTLHEQGQSPKQAALNAAKLRFRPIIMTSMAFIFGVIPLAISTGAGSASQNAIGIGVIGGMVSATTLAIFFVPMFYVFVLNWFGERKDSTISNEHERRNTV